jgi:hypothetical protein
MKPSHSLGKGAPASRVATTLAVLWFVLLAAAMFIACGGSSSSGNPGSGAQGGDSGSPAGDDSSVSPPNDGGPVFQDTGPVYIGQEGGVPDGEVDQTVTLTMEPITVPAGQEVYKCQDFANPFGKDVDIVEYEGQMSQGSHHFFVFPLAGLANGHVGDCPMQGLEIHPFPFLSQAPHTVLTYPPGMGSFISSLWGIRLNVHLVNPTASDVTASAQVTMYVGKSGAVTTHVGTIFMNQISIALLGQAPPSAPVPFARTCGLPQDVNILSSWNHMHKRATDFKVSASGGAPFYESTVWAEPPMFNHSPPLAFKSGTSITWECDYYNDTGGPLTFGESANKNIMCIYVGQYYPANPANPSIMCMQ